MMGRFRNRVLQHIMMLLSLSSGRGQKSGRGTAQRRGRISYAQLGINQLGAVYEGLLSYSGFVGEEEGGVDERKKAGEGDGELHNAYVVPAWALSHKRTQ